MLRLFFLFLKFLASLKFANVLCFNFCFLCRQMALFITSLNSGSNGNCYYVGNEQEAVLIDAGISCREIEKRMQGLQLCLSKVKAIFISHEHIDHIRGIPVLAQKYALPVYATPKTLQCCSFYLPQHLINRFKTAECVQIGDLKVASFSKRHDAAEPCSFNISYNGTTVGVYTDIGASCANLVQHFKQCHAAFLEANYDEQMLATGRYPQQLKNRIQGGFGHLSNRQAAALFTAHKPPHMSHLVLAHLSKENNCPKLVHQLFQNCCGGTSIVVASRFAATPVMKIEGSHITNKITLPPVQHAVQIPLF